VIVYRSDAELDIDSLPSPTQTRFYLWWILWRMPAKNFRTVLYCNVYCSCALGDVKFC